MADSARVLGDKLHLRLHCTEEATIHNGTGVFYRLNIERTPGTLLALILGARKAINPSLEESKIGKAF